jgi:hypothetical protein
MGVSNQQPNSNPRTVSLALARPQALYSENTLIIEVLLFVFQLLVSFAECSLITCSN